MIEPNKHSAVPYYASSATRPVSTSISSKAALTILDESKTTGIPSVEALKTRSKYKAKILEYYQVSYMSPQSDAKVELKV